MDVFDLMMRISSADDPTLSRQLKAHAEPNGTTSACLRRFGLFGGLARLGASYGWEIRYRGEFASPTYRDVTKFIGRLSGDPRLPGKSDRNSFIEARLMHAAIARAVSDLKRVRRSERNEILLALVERAGVPASLRALDDLVDLSRSGGSADPLEDVAVIAHQHLLGSNVALFRTLMSLGCRPERMLCIGKGYSSNLAAVEALRLTGAEVHAGWEGLPDAQVSEEILHPDRHQLLYYEYLEKVTSRFLGSLGGKKGIERVLVLDDGGLVLSIVADYLEREVARERLKGVSFHGVEQTSSGHWLIKRRRRASSDPGTLPIVDVARSRLKLGREARLIGSSIAHEVESALRLAGRAGFPVSSLKDQPVGVLGYGVVGAWTARALAERGPNRVQHVLVFDTDPEKRSLAEAAGFSVPDSPEQLVKSSRVVIGCTGTMLLELDPSWIEAPTAFASGSSWNYELMRLVGGGRFRPRARGLVSSGDRDFDLTHALVEGSKTDRGRYIVLNSGFPVNFTGGVDPISAEEIQLTRALMLGAALYALGVLAPPSDQRHGGSVAPGGLQMEPLPRWLEDEIEALLDR